jgi:cysteine desulfurase
VEAESALLLLERAKVCASAGSACTAGSLQPSHVLRAMGCPREQAKGSLRFSFSRFNTRAEIDRGVEILTGVIDRVRRER